MLSFRRNKNPQNFWNHHGGRGKPRSRHRKTGRGDRGNKQDVIAAAHSSGESGTGRLPIWTLWITLSKFEGVLWKISRPRAWPGGKRGQQRDVRRGNASQVFKVCQRRFHAIRAKQTSDIRRSWHHRLVRILSSRGIPDRRSVSSFLGFERNLLWHLDAELHCIVSRPPKRGDLDDASVVKGFQLGGETGVHPD